MLLTVVTGNVIILGLLSYLAIELRRDVRETRDKMIVMWDWYQNHVERRHDEA